MSKMEKKFCKRRMWAQPACLSSCTAAPQTQRCVLIAASLEIIHPTSVFFYIVTIWCFEPLTVEMTSRICEHIRHVNKQDRTTSCRK